MSDVTEILMDPGSFKLQLLPNTPESVLDSFDQFATVAITAGPLHGQNADDVLATAIYAGRYVTYSEDRHTIEGSSIVTWAGDEDGKGPEITEVVGGGGNVAAALTDLFAPLTNTNGLTLGDTSTVPADTVDATLQVGETARAFLDRLSEIHDLQWRCNPDFSVDVGDRGAIFEADPRVLVTPDPAPMSLAYRVVQGDIDVSRTEEDFATEVRVNDANGIYSGASIGLVFPPKRPDNASLDAEIWVAFEMEDVGSNAACAAQAASDILWIHASHFEISISISLDDPHSWVAPGDPILIWSPKDGLEDTANQMQLDGRVAFPLELQLLEMAWPIGPKMGKYLIRNTDRTVVDLTPWTESSTGPVKLVVAWQRPTIGQTITGRRR